MPQHEGDPGRDVVHECDSLSEGSKELTQIHTFKAENPTVFLSAVPDCLTMREGVEHV